jgi:hypothetical protein
LLRRFRCRAVLLDDREPCRRFDDFLDLRDLMADQDHEAPRIRPDPLVLRDGQADARDAEVVGALAEELLGSGEWKRLCPVAICTLTSRKMISSRRAEFHARPSARPRPPLTLPNLDRCTRLSGARELLQGAVAYGGAGIVGVELVP